MGKTLALSGMAIVVVVGALVLTTVFMGSVNLGWHYLLMVSKDASPVTLKSRGSLDNIFVLSRIERLRIPIVVMRIHRGVPNRTALSQWQIAGPNHGDIIMSGCKSGEMFGNIKTADIYIDPGVFQNYVNDQDRRRLLNMGIARCLWWTINPTISAADDATLSEKMWTVMNGQPAFELNP